MIDFKYGKIVKDDLINTETPFNVNEAFLTEDLFLLQAKDQSLALDVGWYEKEKGACFSIYVIKNEDWDSPLYMKDIENMNTLEVEFYYALGVFDGLIKSSVG